MNENQLYLLDDEDLVEIKALCESVALAVSKMIRRRHLMRGNAAAHPAVEGFDKMTRKILGNATEAENLERLF